jgi:short-subunit dehydrogenase
MHRRTALITGASSGIGAAFAEVFAAEGFDLIVTARRADQLRALADRLERDHGSRVHVIVSDLAEPGAGSRICDEIAGRGLTIDALVNNAGYGVSGQYVANPWQRHEAALQVLVVAVAELTYRVLPGMIERGYGRIVNVASLAALLRAPAGLTLYPASKSFVIKFSESLADEVRSKGVHVTAVAPGFTATAFHDVAGTRARIRNLPRFAWMDAADVARLGYAAVMAGRPLEITGRLNRTVAYLARFIPRRLARYLARRAGEL